MPARGFFVSFEGSEGCGKSTQVARLADRLISSGKNPLVTREPGGTAIGESIRHLLQFDARGEKMTPETELLLFAASRAQLVREIIRPALAAGRTVLADRFLDSTTVYQGVARAIAPAEVAAINGFAVGDTLPDVTFVFDLDAETARARLERRNQKGAPKDRMESQPEAFYEAVRAGYRHLAASAPGRVVMIDARREPGEIESELCRELEARLDGFFR